MKSTKIDPTKIPWNLAGEIKTYPADFSVEEIPLYEPCGEGEHLYLKVRKANISHDVCVRQIAKHFDVSVRDVGCAGRKDLHAVTTQQFSVYLRGRKPEVSKAIGNLEVLSVSFHTNKLRLGHLIGNRFVIRIRGIDTQALPTVRERLQALSQHGMPNFFGLQRFGNNGNNHEFGLALIKEDWNGLVSLLLEGDDRHHDFVRTGEYKRALDAWPFGQPAERNVLEAIVSGKSLQVACKQISKPLRKLWVNALQSHLFNELLHRRLADETWNRVLLGDLAWKHDGGGRTFLVTGEDLQDESLRHRVDVLVVSPSGPLWGSKMRLPAGDVLAAENSVREAVGLDTLHLQSMRTYAVGARRALRVEVTNPQSTTSRDENGEYLELQFALPAGSYATVAVQYCLATTFGFKKLSE